MIHLKCGKQSCDSVWDFGGSKRLLILGLLGISIVNMVMHLRKSKSKIKVSFSYNRNCQ